MVLQSIDDDALMEKVKMKTGMDPAVYRDKARFEKEVASKIRNVLKEQLGIEESQKIIRSDSSTAEKLSDKTCEKMEHG